MVEPLNLQFSTTRGTRPFKKKTTLTDDTETTPVKDPDERKKFDIAAYNAGDARIAKAQELAREAGDDPTKWDDVKKHLEDAGATNDKANEIRQYVDKVSSYEKEFREKSKADADAKFKKGKPIEHYPSGGHWVTIDGRHILIKD